MADNFADLPILDGEDNFADLPIIDEEVAPTGPVGPAAMARKVGGAALDIAKESIGPGIGAAIGAPLGPLGAGAGAAAGRAIQESIENIMVEEEEKKSAQDIAIEAALEPAFLVVGGAIGKGLSKVAGKIPGKAKLGKAVKGLGSKLKSGLLKLNKQFPDLSPTDLETKAVRQFSRTTGLSEALGERLIKRSDSILSKKNLVSAAPDAELMNKASRVWNEAMERTSQKFNKAVVPALKEAGKMPQINKRYAIFKDKIVKEGIFDLTSNTKTSADKFLPGLVSDQRAAAAMNALDKKMAIFRANPTAMKAHELKKALNDILSNSAFKDQSGTLNAAGRSIVGFKTEVLDELSTAIPGYRNAVNEFRSLFEFENAYGRKLNADNINNLFSDLLKDKNSVLRGVFDEFTEKFPPSKQILNSAWDNVAGSSIVAGQVKIKPTGIGVRFPGMPLGERLTTKIVPEKEAAKLVTKSLRGFEPASQAALRSVNSVLLGGTVRESLTDITGRNDTLGLRGEAK
jgi:hypothetical protein